ncbi:hypothetical protein VTO42DRAFT_528 [Malbranchea cinnamomea]
MAFKNGLSEHLDELRLASPRSPPSESPFSSFPSLPGTKQSFPSAFQSPLHDIRSTIQRRFTTDSTKFSPWIGWTPQAQPLPEPLDLLTSATQLHKSQLYEKKRQHIEYMREQRKRFEADLKLLDLQQEKEKKEMEELARDLAKAGLNGPVSEPTTPPEYRDNGFPSMFSRPARFSISSGTPSSLLFNNIFTSQIATPATKPTIGSASNHGSISESVLSSRRNSEQDSSSTLFQGFRPGHSVRYSLPTSNLSSGLNAVGSNKNGFPKSTALDPFLSHKHLLGEEEEDKPKEEERMSTPDVSSYLRLTDPDDKFPTLVRREDNPGVLSANSAALDLANCHTPVPENYGNGARHHSAHQSLPQNSLSWFNSEGTLDKTGLVTSATTSTGYTATRHASSLSLESGFPAFGNHNQSVTPSQSRPASLHMSYSMNDIPTTRRTGGFYDAVTPPRAHSEQGNGMGIGYAPTPQSNHSVNSVTPPTPQSGEQDPHTGFNGGPSFPVQMAAATASSPNNGSITPTMGAFPIPLYGYGIPQVNGNHAATYTAQSSFVPYGSQPYPSYPRFPEGSRGSGHGRRNTESDVGPFSRFSNVPLETYRGELYSLCKDQHGCRYLQRKLEERNPDNVQMIFDETNMHVVELMTDPFGNYLCQKLLEFSNDDQRTILIRNAAPHLVQIALNQHGTRALQKMIEYISTPEQTRMVIEALRNSVVELVQDLNGNHVIQKCLNRLSAADSQFIYDAVGANCITVGTHRHGCCVLQRCIDHASGDQRARLISQITSNAFALVQDPFGNYVVQYILDLAEPHFTEPICAIFRGSVAALSKQKFSSNVIEKCIRTADFQTRRQLIQEIMAPNELERMLRDSFANYVVQTAIDFADPETRTKLLDAVRPILPSIRQTPHGRRIAGKLVSLDAQNRSNLASANGPLAPNGLLSEENGLNGMYPHGRSLPTAATQHVNSQLTTGRDATGNGSSATTSNADDATTVIYSPIPQHGKNAINGISGANAPSFSLY